MARIRIQIIPGRHAADPESRKIFDGDLHAHIKGRPFGDMSVYYPGFSAMTLIAGAPHIAHSIFVDALGRSIDEIDVTRMEALGNNTSGKRKANVWSFAKSINEQQSSLLLLASLCEESGSILIKDSQGRERMTALDYYEPSVTLSLADILERDGKPQYSVAKTPLANIRNEFFLSYRYNYARGSFDRQMFITADETNMTDNARSNDDGSGATYTALCTTSQLIYGVKRRWTLSAEWIRSSAVAELLLKHIANWLSIRRFDVSGEFLYTSNTLKLELGDPALLSLNLLPATVQADNVFLATRIVDGGLVRPGLMTLGFTMVPQVMGTYGEGYGFNYGEDYGTNL